MIKVIYKNKKITWRWAAVEIGKFGKPLFFYFNYHQINSKPLSKVFAFINITPFYFIRNNCETSFGLAFLWLKLGAYFHR
jgi:hypothetical protein